MATLYRSPDGVPSYYTARDLVGNEHLHDATGRAVFDILGNENVYRCSDRRWCYWIDGNYIFAPGGILAFYFDPIERADELARYAAQEKNREARNELQRLEQWLGSPA